MWINKLLEAPSNNYLSHYNKIDEITSEKKNILNEIGIKENKFEFYDDYFDNNIMRKFLNFENKDFYFEKLLLAINQKNYENKKNINFQYTNKEIFYNAKSEIYNLTKYKNFKLFKNTFVSDIVKSDSKLKLIINDKIYNQKFDKIILACGTVGSSIIV